MSTRGAIAMHSVLVLLSTAFALVANANDAPKSQSATAHPGDVPKSHVEEIASGPHKYTIVQGGHDGRPELPLADGVRHRARGRLPPDLGVQPLGADGERGRDRRRQPVALQRPQQLPQRRGDRRRGRHARHDRRGEGLRPLVPGDPVSPPFRRRQQRTRRPGEGLQRLRLQHLRQRFHLPGHAVARRPA